MGRMKDLVIEDMDKAMDRIAKILNADTLDRVSNRMHTMDAEQIVDDPELNRAMFTEVAAVANDAVLQYKDYAFDLYEYVMDDIKWRISQYFKTRTV